MDCAMPQSWDAFLRTLYGVYDLKSADILPYPGVQYILMAGVHTFFFSSFLLVWVWKGVKKALIKSASRSSGGHRISDCGTTVGNLYRATILASVILCIAHLTISAWSLMRALKDGWKCDLLSITSGCIEAMAWLVMTVVSMHAKAERRQMFPQLLRLWWIASFSLSVLCVFTDSVGHGTVQIDSWANMMDLLVCTYLLCVAIFGGKTGIHTKTVLEDLQEPLLNVCSDMPSIFSVRNSVSYYEKAGFFSSMTFSWLDPLLRVGYKKSLELDDIPELTQTDSASHMFELFRNNWDRYETKSLSKCIAQTLWKEVALNACCAGTCTCASYVGPALINDFVEFVGARRRFAYEGFLLVGVFFLAKLVESLAQRQWFFGAQKLGLRTRVGLTSLIFRKGLSLSNQSRQNHTSGEIINYVSVDVERVSDFSWYLHELWLLPLQLSLAFSILFRSVGIAALATFGATAVIMLANIPLSSILEKFQNDIMKSKDARMKATSEVLRSMRILKLQAWELHYMKKIEDLRKVEYDWLRRFLYFNAASLAIFWTTPAFVAAITFGTCVIIGIPLTTGKVLSALATFRILQDPIYGIPDLVAVFVEARVSLLRIQNFLQEEDLDVLATHREQADEGDMAVEIHGACFSWDACLEKPTITLPELEIKRGTKVAVCGMVGCGKSSFISCILGEIPKLSGSIKVVGSQAYVSQSAWIQSGKIQDNILFGKAMDKEKYDSVLKACSLEKDLMLFAHGDQTEIGERGINLSGGQKQRIQIARALYQDADIYLLDDPFSAVDALTGTHLFKECILEALESRTVIYVTHQVEFLPAADLILVLEGGKISQCGKFDDLLQAGTNFGKLIGAHTKALESIDVPGNTMVGYVDDSKERNQVNDSMPDKEDEPCNVKPDRQIVEKEERETGRVSAIVYWSLVTAVHNGAIVPLILLAQILFQALQIASNYWIAWGTPIAFQQHPKFDSHILLLVYIGLASASSVFIFSRAFLLSMVALKTSQKFFLDMLHSVFYAPMSFFDSTPTGRILNRASTDQSALDLEACNRLAGLAFNIIQLTGIIVVMSQIAWPVFLLFIIVMGFSFWLQTYYIESARELSRLVGIHKAPIIHHFGESIAGAAIIRAFDQEVRFMETNLKLTDCYARPLFNNFAAMEWLCLRLNAMSSFLFAFALLLVVVLPELTVDASIAGLAVTYGLNLTWLQYLVVWNLCKVENTIISVERIRQYTRIRSEAPLVVEGTQPAADWPSDGTISLENLQVRYAEHMPMVLRGITCIFPGGNKIGVVGRTGSGKSTLIQALFRIVEPVAGRIVIDNVDVSRIGLHHLRSKLSIIPQDPTLFEGTIRSNLDPLEEHSDVEIWEALEKSQLGDVVRAKEGKLDTSVNENGENWSAGQRQLFCLGRALLKRTRILVLDEATASVDAATDGIIQEKIRKEFSQCTVITIAHRIPTVIDSDHILLLSDGKVAEYDLPVRLLEDRMSLFAKLVSEYSTRSSTVSHASVH